MSEEYIQDSWPEAGRFCWGCGKNNPHGLQLKSYWQDDETIATFTPKKHHLAFPGILNGGIIATIIDCHGTGTANAAAHKHDGEKHLMHVTASLSIKFLKPTPLDEPVTLKARISESNGNKTVVECSLYSGDTVCAVGEVVTVGVNPDMFVNKELPTFSK
jgi:acyl-coenzyme A thioesterase PaaI-like protein